MNERWLLPSFTASSLIHLGLIPLAAAIMHAKPIKPINVPVEMIDRPRVEAAKKIEAAPPLPPPAPKPQPKIQPKPRDISAPKLLSMPVLEAPAVAPTGNTQETVKEEPLPPIPPPLSPLPERAGSVAGGWNEGGRAGEAAGGAAGAGNLFGRGDVGVVGGSGVSGGGGGTGNSGLGRGGKGDGAGGGGSGSGEALAGLARPLGGYQVKPRYPEAARRAGAQGVTTLRVRVLETGRVGEVLIASSAGFRDLDLAAVDAVKKWRFEPARRGREAVPVWVMLPVKFELR